MRVNVSVWGVVAVKGWIGGGVAVEGWMWRGNTFLMEEDSKLITYQSGDNRNMDDHLMVRKTDHMKPQNKTIHKFVPTPIV